MNLEGGLGKDKENGSFEPRIKWKIQLKERKYLFFVCSDFWGMANSAHAFGADKNCLLK